MLSSPLLLPNSWKNILLHFSFTRKLLFSFFTYFVWDVLQCFRTSLSGMSSSISHASHPFKQLPIRSPQAKLGERLCNAFSEHA